EGVQDVQTDPQGGVLAGVGDVDLQTAGELACMLAGRRRSVMWISRPPENSPACLLADGVAEAGRNRTPSSPRALRSSASAQDSVSSMNGAPNHRNGVVVPRP